MSREAFTLGELAQLMHSSGKTLMDRLLKPGYVTYSKLSTGYRYAIPKGAFFRWFVDALESGQIYDILPGTAIDHKAVLAARDEWLKQKAEPMYPGHWTQRQAERMNRRLIHIKEA